MFRPDHEVAVLAIYRGGQAYPSQIENTPLKVGDVLLLQGSEQHVRGLARPPDLWMLQSATEAPLSTRKGLYALAAMSAAILLGSTGLLPLSIAFLLAVILTRPISNAAAVLVLLPVAISTSEMLDMNARPFAIIVTLSASLSFITPLEPANLLVFGIGKYRFFDFFKVGLPLTIIVIVLLVFLVPMLWPFQ